MQGIILAAGLGTRLAPYTYVGPKPLFRLGQKALLDFVLQKMIASRISPLVINLFYFPMMVKRHVLYNYPEIPIIFSDERFEILGTGGGIVQAASFLKGSDDVLIHNVDVLSGLSLETLIEIWHGARCDVLLVVKERHSSRELLFDAQTLRWIGWRGNGKELKVEESTHFLAYGFCGISIFKTSILQECETGKNYSFIKLLQMVHHKGYLIKAHLINDWWVDVGSLDNIKLACSISKTF
ncbi:MAG: sugar phosphate nucleotidyltransferase [Bacteroidales bacterium]|nr:sugar phosphate nucleotidyltransferase [Bacteroidales bacterium]